jgi:hypothetical protein
MTYLFVWQIVTHAAYAKTYEWKNLGAFESPAACHKAAENLAIQKISYRCISRLRGEME